MRNISGRFLNMQPNATTSVYDPYVSSAKHLGLWLKFFLHRNLAILLILFALYPPGNRGLCNFHSEATSE